LHSIFTAVISSTTYLSVSSNIDLTLNVTFVLHLGIRALKRYTTSRTCQYQVTLT